MSDEKINVTPSVTLTRIAEIRTYEVQEMELKNLDSTISDETQALAFFTFSLGVLLTAVLGYLSSSELSKFGHYFYNTVTILAFVGTIWFAATWIRKKKNRLGILSEIRRNATKS